MKEGNDRRPPEASSVGVTLIPGIVFLAAAAAAYSPALGFWWDRWLAKDSFYSHGPFVPLASGFLVWANHKRLASLRALPCRWGYGIMIVFGLAGWLAWMGASASMMGFTLPPFLFGAVMAIFGTQVAKRLAFPILLLWFAAPPPESVLAAASLKVQLFSIQVATWGLNTVGVHSISRGAFIDLPGLSVQVGSECSGYRLSVSMLAIAAFIAYIRRGPAWVKPAVVAFALPLSLAVNSVRVFVTTLVGHLWGTSVLLAVHDWAGYLLLVFTAGLLFGFARIVGCGRYREIPLA